MKHYEFEISLLVEDELPEDQKQILLSHLSVCGKCRQTLEDYSKIKNDVYQFYDVLPSQPFNAEVKTSFNNKPSTISLITWSFGIAVIVILLFLFLLSSNKKGTKNQTVANDSLTHHSIMIPETEIQNHLYTSDSYRTFNEAIDSAITLRQDNLFYVQNRDEYNEETKKFNRVIDSVLYSKKNLFE